MPPRARILEQENPADYGTMLMLILVAVTFCSSAIFVAVAVFLHCVCQRRPSGGVNPSAAGSTQRRWLRRARGLSPSAVSSLPAFAYQKGADGDGGGGCAVCLDSVCDGETVRRLPMCKHLFHVECIDMWLYSHSTCPVCRAVVGPADVAMDHRHEATAATAVVHLPV